MTATNLVGKIVRGAWSVKNPKWAEDKTGKEKQYLNEFAQGRCAVAAVTNGSLWVWIEVDCFLVRLEHSFSVVPEDAPIAMPLRGPT